MTNLRTLLEDRATAWSAVTDIRERAERSGIDLNEEETTSYRSALADVERLSQKIEDEERAQRLDRLVNSVVPDSRTNPVVDQVDPDADQTAYRAAFEDYLRRGMSGVSPEDRNLLQSGYVGENRAQGTDPNTAGGYLVPQEFLNRMVETLKAFGGVFALAEVLPTATGVDLPWPTNDDTNNEGAIIGENTAATEQDFEFDEVLLKTFTYTSKMVRVPNQLMQDSAFNLALWLPVRLGTRIGRRLARDLINGDGVAAPQGIVTALSASALETAASGKVTFDDLIDLEHGVDPAYRERASWLASDKFIAEVRKLKDTQGRYLWAPSVAAGVPSTINGRPYTVDNSMADPTVGEVPAIFGDIATAMVVRQVAGAQTRRLDERFAEFNQTAFLGFARYGAVVQDPHAAKALKIKA